MAFTPLGAALELGLTLAEYAELQAAEMAAAGAEAELASAEAAMPRQIAYVAGGSVAALGVGEAVIHRSSTNATTPARSGPHSTPSFTPLESARKRLREELGHDPLSGSGGQLGNQSSSVHLTDTPGSFTNMPWPRIVNTKRRYTRKGTYRKRATVPRAPRVTTQKIKKIVYSVAEKKYYDQVLSMTQPVANWGVQFIGPPIQQGNAVGNRQGNRVFIKYVELDHNIKPAAPATFKGAQVRCLFVWRKENDGATTWTYTDIFRDNRIQSVRNQEQAGSLKILADWTTTIPAGQSVEIGTRRIIKVNMPMTFTGTAGTGADINGGCMYMFCFNTQNAPGGSGPAGDDGANVTCAGTIRIHFTDV